MMKMIQMALVALVALAGSHRISSVETGGSWIYLYNSEGQRYKTLSASSVGEVTGVAGQTFTSRNGAWVYTWDKNGKKLNTRVAR